MRCDQVIPSFRMRNILFKLAGKHYHSETLYYSRQRNPMHGSVDPQSRSYKVVGRGATKRRGKHLNFTRYYVTLVLKGLMNVDRTRLESIVAKQNRDQPSSFACIPIILVPLGKVNLVTVYQCALSSPMEFPSACAEHRLSQVIFAVISAGKNSV